MKKDFSPSEKARAGKLSCPCAVRLLVCECGYNEVVKDNHRARILLTTPGKQPHFAFGVGAVRDGRDLLPVDVQGQGPVAAVGPDLIGFRFERNQIRVAPLVIVRQKHVGLGDGRFRNGILPVRSYRQVVMRVARHLLVAHNPERAVRIGAAILRRDFEVNVFKVFFYPRIAQVK